MVESNFVVHDVKPSKENMRNVCEPFTRCGPLRDMVFEEGNTTYLFSCLNDTSVWIPELPIKEREKRDKEVTVGINKDRQPSPERFQIPEFRASIRKISITLKSKQIP